MNKKAIFVFLILSSSIAFADAIYFYKGDLNGDGYVDKLESIRESGSGNAGITFLLTLSKGKEETIEKQVFFHPMAIALEKRDGANKLWGYWRASSEEGKLFSLLMDDGFQEESITINPKTDLGSSLYEAIFFENKLHLNYRKTPPINIQ